MVSEAVAVVSDGSNPRHGGRRIASVPMDLVLADYATMIHDLTGLRAHPLAVAARNAVHLAASVRGFPVDIGMVFLTHTDPGRARVAQEVLRTVGVVPVVTDQDTAATILAAAVLATLARADRTPSSSRVVIAGAEQLPELRALLMVCGVGDIVSWNRTDALGFPLRRITRSAHVVVDLLTEASGTADIPQGPGGSVTITLDDPTCHLLALPGLLAAMAHAPEPVLDVALCRACAVAPMTSTPQGSL
ncbi:hypothetical protein [Umezawaea sp. Da 62-37]|uniref:hypothetical protein n=1 Tax=Umezawaea sp. Da 62-37 TaxID=3075927 RepID=UPI0028F721E3|nr:hypothetical protein [Umezawaea sp. Da 62-37]WNV84862.1 hypothetical protein RM788_43005 [Umezawaea sp. Da 62-37]